MRGMKRYRSVSCRSITRKCQTRPLSSETVVSEPEALQVSGAPCCRYRLGVDRKYYIKTQSDLTADYPWVYSFQQQAERDFRHLKQGSVILVDAFIQNRRVEGYMTCSQCGAQYRFPDAATEFIPFSIEYLSDYITDEELALGDALEKQKEIADAYCVCIWKFDPPPYLYEVYQHNRRSPI